MFDRLEALSANAAFAENAKHLESLPAAKDSGSLLTEWADRLTAGAFFATRRRSHPANDH